MCPAGDAHDAAKRTKRAVTSIPGPCLRPVMATVDGSHGEGGGQIVRTALFLSVLLRQPIEVTRIRAGRANPGLKPQHAAILRALAAMTGSRAEGADVGSTHLRFHPGEPAPGTHAVDIGTGGCIPLLLQTLLPVAIATPGTTVIHATGGTDVPFGPTIAWLRQAYLPYVSPLAAISLDVQRHGFAAQGGGRVTLTVTQAEAGAGSAAGMRRLVAAKLGARRIRQGPVTALGIRSLASGVGRDVAQRQAFAALAHLVGIGPAPAVEAVQVDASGPGSSITCWAEDAHGNRLASDRLGAPRSPAEDVGRLAATNLAEDLRSGATVDRHLADHVVPWVALGAGAVRVPHMTPHLETNAWLCNEMLGVNAVRADRNLVR